MPKSCCVVGCTSRKKVNSPISFMLIPSNKERREEWIKNIRLINGLNWCPRKHDVLCSLHFDYASWENNRVDGKKKLRWNAAPTVFTGQTLHADVRRNNRDPTNHVFPVAQSAHTDCDADVQALLAQGFSLSLFSLPSPDSENKTESGGDKETLWSSACKETFTTSIHLPVHRTEVDSAKELNTSLNDHTYSHATSPERDCAEDRESLKNLDQNATIIATPKKEPVLAPKRSMPILLRSASLHRQNTYQQIKDEPSIDQQNEDYPTKDEQDEGIFAEDLPVERESIASVQKENERLKAELKRVKSVAERMCRSNMQLKKTIYSLRKKNKRLMRSSQKLKGDFSDDKFSAFSDIPSDSD